MIEDKEALENRSSQLRLELKVWEKQFAADSGGCRASREDIKANVAIAAKYKEYNKIRDALSGKTKASNASKPDSKSKPTANRVHSPSNHPYAVNSTPQKRKESFSQEEAEPDAVATPALKRTMIGPTPQKDGRILGIFDILPFETPSKPRTILGDKELNVAMTPTKSALKVEDDAPLEENVRGSRTPASTGKRFLLDSFVTPRKRSIGEEGTPSSSMNQLATPAFLRRNLFPLSTVTEEPQSPEIARPWKRRSFGRSLSGIIQDLRKQEAQKADEEWEIMCEIDNEETPKAISRPAAPKVMVEDSQTAVALDVDGFVPSDFETDTETQEDKGVDGQPRKPWKKKGLKRQTRRVIMRPVHTKSQQKQSPELSAVTATDPARAFSDTRTISNSANEIKTSSDNEYPGTDNEELPDVETSAPQEKQKISGTAKTAQKPGRKINPQVHANYRRLKIKGKNTKPKGRFGRKR